MQQEPALAVTRGRRRASPEGLLGVAGQPSGVASKGAGRAGCRLARPRVEYRGQQAHSAHGGLLSALGSGAHGPADWRQAVSRAKWLVVAAGCSRGQAPKAPS